MESAFDMTELERAAEFVHRVIPPTHQYPWPELRRSPDPVPGVISAMRGNIERERFDRVLGGATPSVV